jgi:hypothetical protein
MFLLVIGGDDDDDRIDADGKEENRRNGETGAKNKTRANEDFVFDSRGDMAA